MATAAVTLSPTTVVEAGMKAAGVTITLDLTDDTWIAVSSYTEELFWNGDHPSGTTYFYTAHRTSSSQATFTNSPDIVAGGTDPGTASSDGGNVAKIDASFSSRISFPVTGSTFSTSAGSFSILVYPTGATGDNRIFNASVNTDNEFKIEITQTNRYIFFLFQGNAGNVGMLTSTYGLVEDQWNTVKVRWNTTTNLMGIKVNSNAWEETTATDIVPFATEPTTVLLNDDDMGTTDRPMYYDALQIWTTSDET